MVHQHQKIEVADDARLSGLPTFTRQGIISKANQILQSGQVFEGPLKGSTHCFSVGSFSADHPTKLMLKVWVACTEMLCACSSCVPTERNANQVSRLVCKNQSNFTHIVNMNVKRQALGRKAKDRLPRDRKKEGNTNCASAEKSR